MGVLKNHPGYAAFLFTPSTRIGYISSLAVPTPAAGLAFVGLAIVGWVKRRLA